MPQPIGYKNRASERATVASLIADYLANGGVVHRFTCAGKLIR